VRSMPHHYAGAPCRHLMPHDFLGITRGEPLGMIHNRSYLKQSSGL
jgi:hypothetical protein